MTERTPEQNRILTERFPFLLPRNVWTDEVPEDYDYSYTLYDAVPAGWRKAFGTEMLEEIREECLRFGFLEKLRINQIKEKFGTLRIYISSAPKGSKLCEILEKYEDRSAVTCIRCGRPAEWISLNWISPWCGDCCKEGIEKHPDWYMKSEQYYSE